MKVYIVIEGVDYEGYSINKVFANKADANAYADALSKELSFVDYVEVIEQEVV